MIEFVLSRYKQIASFVVNLVKLVCGNVNKEFYGKKVVGNLLCPQNLVWGIYELVCQLAVGQSFGRSIALLCRLFLNLKQISWKYSLTS